MTFKALADNESPMLGLFFLESEENLDPTARVNRAVDRPLAAGIASLVSEDGIVATCSHVILALDARPGMRVCMFGATASVSVEVTAEVLAEGWRGPLFDEQGARMPSPFWTQWWDERPDVFREDIVFLRLLPETARWHERHESVRERSHKLAVDQLLECARVLPVSRAGYRRPGATLTAWCVAWIHGAPDCHPGHAEFRSFDVEGFHAVRAESTSMRPGFSGGPLWDEHRRVVVGLVRRALPAMGTLVLATDGLALCGHSSVRLTPDSRLQALERQIATSLRQERPERYADMGSAERDRSYIEPQLTRVQGSLDPLKKRRDEELLAAIGFLSVELTALKRVVIRGAAGIGKSILLRSLATALLESSDPRTQQRVVPLVLTAADFVESGTDVGKYVDALWATARSPDMRDDIVDVLAENGALLALLVDGIDEIGDKERAKVLGRLDIRREARSRVAKHGESTGKFEGYIAATLVTTRPSEAWESSGSTVGVAVRSHLFELMRFDQDQIDRFCAQEIPDIELRKRFRDALRKLRWARDRVTPLQLQMAASVFLWRGELPARSIDLTAIFVNLAIDQARKEFLTRSGRPLRDEVRELYLPAIHEILGLVGAATVEAGGDGLPEERFVEAFTELRQTKPLAWTTNLGSLVEFLYRDFSPFLALLTPRPEHRQIDWAHRTFAEMLSALHMLVTHGSSASLRDRLFAMLQHGHGPALSLLGVLDRVKDDGTSEDILKRCISGEYGATRSQLFALRALGAGLDASGRTRRAQVKLLVRHLVSDVREAGLCIHFFLHEDLPDARDLLAYPELREDLFDVMLERFKPRMARAAATRQVIVMARESMILKHADLWPEFLDLGLRRPPSDDPQETLDIGAPSDPRGPGPDSGHGGVARILVRRPDGSVRVVNMTATDFVASLAHVARHTSGHTLTSELVQLTLEIQMEKGDIHQLVRLPDSRIARPP